PMVFASLCDARGVVELTLFEQAAQQYGASLKQGGVVLARGTVQRDDERGVGVVVHEVRSLDER
ncbi:MAG: OB-fold nucleic acid binding domain-containing protein, partial [Chloroflexota bacterium]|nr:OB-fold nucleic acid binding domain-containing protein [Chloroflexota bacterium]